MATLNFPVKTVERFCVDAFEKFGFTRKEAEQITDVLLLADVYGIQSHGTQRLVRYHKSIENGSVKIDAKPEIVFETPVSAVIDGHEGMGQLIGIFAMEKAIEKAKKSGMAFVTVRNSNHFGIAGYYTKMACDQGLIGVCGTNSLPIMVPTGAKEAMLGSNPLAFAVPADPVPFWFDAATTVVPKGKLEVYFKAGKDLKEGWAIDNTGAVSTDAEFVLKCMSNKDKMGGILPLGGAGETNGGHKGYGYSMVCEIMSAIFSLGTLSKDQFTTKGKGAGTCHSFMVIDPAIFGDPQAIKDYMSKFLAELRNGARADEATPIYTHGEKELIAIKRCESEGIDIDVSTVAEMVNVCKYLGMDSVAYFGEVDTSGAKSGIYETAFK